MMNRLRQWARTLKREVTLLWLAARDPRTPLAAKLVAGGVAAYALSPIDLSAFSAFASACSIDLPAFTISFSVAVLPSSRRSVALVLAVSRSRNRSSFDCSNFQA